MVIGNAIGAGIEMAGANSGYMRSIGYTGFASASSGLGYAGFLMYSGSVLPLSGDNYAGVGLELVSPGGSGSLRFSTNPSRFEVIAESFYVGSSTSQFISGSEGQIEISSSGFWLQPNGDVFISGSVTATSGYIGGWQILNGQLSSNVVRLQSTGSAGLYIQDANGNDKVLVVSKSMYVVGSETDLVGNDSFEEGTGSFIPGRNLDPTVPSWSLALGGHATSSLTDRSGYEDKDKAVHGDYTLDVIVPSGVGNYTSNNTYDISQIITGSFTSSNVLSFKGICRFSHSLGGVGYNRNLEEQLFRVEYLSASAWYPFLPNSTRTGSDGFGFYRMGQEQYASFGGSAVIPFTTDYVRIHLSGSVNSDATASFTVSKNLSDPENSLKYKTYKYQGAKYPETELTFDSFDLKESIPRVELIPDGLLIYNSEDSYIRMTTDGIDIRGGSGHSIFGSSVSVNATANDMRVGGNLDAPSIQAGTNQPLNVNTGSDIGLAPEYSREDHVHDLPFSTLDSVIGEDTITSLDVANLTFSGSNFQVSGAIHVSASDDSYFIGGGGVGIGTITTTKLLQVNGESLFTGTVSMSGDLKVEGTITAQEFHTEFVSSSIIYSSGSTKFGDDVLDRHDFTGSINASGSVHRFLGVFSASSLDVVGNIIVGGNVDGIDLQIFSSSIESRVVSNDSDILALQNDSASFSTRIENNDTDILVLQIASASFSSSITALHADSASFSTRIENNDTDIAVLQIASASFSSSITALHADSASFGLRIENNDTNILALQNDSASFSTRIENNDTDILVLQNASASFSSSIIALQADSASFGLRIENNDTDILALQNDSASFSTRIENNDTDILILQVASASFSSSIVGLLNDSASFGLRIENNDIEILALQNDSASFSTRIENNDTDILVLQNASASFSSSIVGLLNDSASFGLRIENNDTDILALQNDSGSFSTRVTLNESSMSSVALYTASLSHYLDNLTDGEVQQLMNIDSVTISNTQWGYLGVFDQGLTTTSNVIFGYVTSSNFDINGGDIASGVVINKSPVVNFNSGDVQGSITLTNLASGTGALTIQPNSVEGTMMHTSSADAVTLELSADTLSVIKVPSVLTAGTNLNSPGTFDGSTARTINLDDTISLGTVTASNALITNLTIETIVSASNLDVAGTITAPNIGTDTDDTVVILNSSGLFKTDEIDSRVWGSTLANLGNGSNNRLVTATDANSLNGEANLTFDGTSLTLTGNFSGSGGGYFLGDVGIGITNPAFPLDVVGNVRMQSDVSMGGTAADPAVYIVDSTKYIGIGISTPTVPLQVNGTLSGSGLVYFPNIGAGVDNSVVVLDSDGSLRTDEINSVV